MTEGLNKVQLIGNLGLEPELRYTQGGQALLRMRIATSSSYPNKAGERVERTEWHTAVLWGPRAESLHKIIAKGRQLYVEGRLQTRSWEDRDGNKRYTTEVNAQNVLLLGRGDGNNYNPGAGGSSASGAGDDSSPGGHDPFSNQGGGENPFGGDEFNDDNIPF